jgi:N-acyl-D-aspartate/D-glutamate deacylase
VELLELCSVLGDFEGTSLEFLPLAGGAFTPEVTQLLTRMSLAARSPLNWNLINATAASQPETLARLEASTYAEEHGARVVALVTVSPNIGQYSFLNGFVLDAFPGWEEPMSLPPDEKLKLLADPEQRRRLLKLSQEGNPLQSYADWPTRIITETFTPETKQYEGRMVGEIAAEQGREPFDVLLDIVCADGLRTTFSFLPPDDTPEEWAARRAAWEDPRTVVGGSDAGAHLDVIASYSYPTQLLAAVRKQGVLSLERAVQLLTSQPAELYGLRDRGRLVEGGAGDVVIFDPSTVGPGSVTTRFDLPGGAPRLYCDASGIAHVIVNGETIIEDGSYNNALPGRVLRRGRDTSSPAMSYDVSGAPTPGPHSRTR